MKTYLLTFLFVLAGCWFTPSIAQAQSKKNESISKEAFRKKQKDFIIREAGLTPKEANFFFPLYFELQDKKKLLTDDADAKRKKAMEQDLHERQYESAVNQILNAHVSLEKLEREYVEKYRKQLSNKKIFRIMIAEINFRKELIKSTRQWVGSVTQV